MRKLTLAAVLFLLSSSAALAQTFTSGPTSGSTVLAPETDYAALQWGDSWDMDKRTDVGWFTWGIDSPGSNMSSKAMVGCTSGTTGCSGFRFSATSAFANLFLLDSWVPGSAIIDKVGKLKPIDTTKYKYLLLKMKVNTGVLLSEYGPVAGGAPQLQISFSRNTLYYDETARPNSGRFLSLTNGGTNPAVVLDTDGMESSQWAIYAIRLDLLDWWNTDKNPGVITSVGKVWGNSGVTADSMFLSLPNTDQLAARFSPVDIAWARLTTTTQTSQTIAWTGGASTYDIVVSPNSDCSGFSVLAENQPSNFSFDFGALPPGEYHVGLRAAQGDNPSVGQTTIAACSGGTYVVPDFASLTFTTPTDEGSSDDFATTFFNNPWDFSATSDAEVVHDLTSTSIDSAFPAERPSGASLGNIRVFKGTSPVGGDSYIYPFWFNGQGLDTRIDPSRYRIASIDMGLDAQRSINGGSIGRIIWHVSGDATYSGTVVTRALENVGEDLALRHLKFGTETNNVYILDRIQVDMKNRGLFPVETDTDPPAPNEASPSRSGWASSCISPYCPTTPSKPGVDGFRIKFHELPAATLSYIKQAKLAALEQTGSTYTLGWTVNVPSQYSSPVLKLYASKQTSAAAASGVSLTPTSTCEASDSTPIAINGSGTALSSGQSTGSYAWDVNAVSAATLANGAEVYVCGVVQGTISSTTFTIAAVMTQFPIVINRTFASKPRLHFDKSTLRFSAIRNVAGASLVSKTPDQVVGITQVGSGTATWRVESILDTNGAAVSYITVSPTSGSGSGTATVSLVNHTSIPACTAQDGLGVIIKLVSDGTTQNEPQYIRVYVTIRPQKTTGGCVAPTTAAFGAFDTPANNATGLIGAIAVTGWALDDIGVQKVEIWRNCVEAIDRARGACVSPAPGVAGNFVFIGTGAFLAGARPDVEAALISYPVAYRAGWGYLMLTNALPHLTNGTTEGGQGTFTLTAYAVDFEGRYTSLGTKTITLDNDNATLPFGAIDTPTQGGIVPEASAPLNNADAYPNFGWAMTQVGKCIDTSSTSSYRVYIDGVQRTLTTNTNWFPGLNRSDIAAAYPGYCNTNNGLAAYYINATGLGLTSGLHTIGWDVIDNASQVAGIGSRFFNLIVTSGSASLRPAGPALGGPAQMFDVERLVQGDVVAERQRTGYPTETIPDQGGRRTLVAEEIERLRVELPKAGGASAWDGYLVNRGELVSMPLGATFDGENGTFYWQPVAGYLGNYDFIFVRRGTDGQPERLPLRVTYRPKSGLTLAAGSSPERGGERLALSR